MLEQENTSQRSYLGITAAFLRSRGVVGSALTCACVSIPVAGVVAVCSSKLWPIYRTTLDSFSAPQLALLAIIVAPILETIFFQFLVGTVAKACTRNMGAQLAIICIPFALNHFLRGIPVGLSAGVVGGVVFGFLFIAWQEVSVSKAILATMLTHALHNAAAIAADHFS